MGGILGRSRIELMAAMVEGLLLLLKDMTYFVNLTLWPDQEEYLEIQERMEVAFQTFALQKMISSSATIRWATGGL